MPKEKKITFRYYLNTALQSVPMNGVDRYPVYARVSFNRKSNQFFYPLLYADGYLSHEEFTTFFVEHKSREIYLATVEYESDLTKIIRNEFAFLGVNGFSLAGINKRYFEYHQPITSIMEDVCRTKLMRHLEAQGDGFTSGFFDSRFLLSQSWELLKNFYKENLSQKISSEVQFFLQAYTLLKSYLHSLSNDQVTTGLDWLEKSHQSGFKSFLDNGLYRSRLEARDFVLKRWNDEFLPLSVDAEKVIHTLNFHLLSAFK